MIGRCRIWFHRKGYGFIKTEELDSIFIHYSDITSRRMDYKELRSGQEVSFELEQTDKGYKARNLILVEELDT